jgi:hypothetical protein
MTHGSDDGTRERLKHRLQRTHDCIPVEQVGRALGDIERRHLAMCARCQAEFALWQAIADDAVHGDEDAASRVAVELRGRMPWTRPAHVRPGSARRVGFRSSALLAASVALALTAGYVAWDPEPRVEEIGSAEQGYRDAGIRVVSPVGDLDRVPDELTWIAVDGEVQYDVRVLEVDGTLLWRTTSSSASVPIPPRLRADFVPGKTLVWDVTARDGAGVAVAHSGTQQARVRVLAPPRRR